MLPRRLRYRILEVLPVVLALLDGRLAFGTSIEPPESPLLRVQVVKELAGDYQASGEIVARQEAGRAAEIRSPFVVPPGQSSVEVTVPLPSEGSWWFTVDGPGLFASRKVFSFPLEVHRVTLGIRPLVRLKGRLVVRAGSPIEGRDTHVRWHQPGSTDLWESVKADVHPGFFEAEVPAGTWDIAVKVTGCASYRREGMVVAPGATMDLGAVPAVPGASLVGRIAVRDGHARPVQKETRVTLSPAGEIPGASSIGNGIVLEKEVRPSPLGEFQFVGLTAGRYNLRVFARGFAREDRVVDLVPDKEVEFREPILLARPASLQIDLSPPLDPRSLAWVVELRETGEAGWLRDAGLTRKSSAGVAVFENVRLKANYTAVIRAGNGDTWRVQAVTIDASRTRLPLRLDSAQVAGRLTLGGEPLAAEVIFGGRNAAPSIRTESGEDGEFGAELPRAGPWRVAVHTMAPRVSREVSIEVPEPKDGHPARIDIALPATHLRVRVVNSSGAAATNACLVHFESLLTHEAQTEKTATGEVEFLGLEAGEWILHAESRRAFSERQTVKIEEKGHLEVTLTLTEKRVVEGVVLSSLGEPVPYTRLQPLRWDSRADTFPQPVLADALGRFRLEVPSEVERIGVLVLAPGLAVTSTVFAVGESAVVTVQIPPIGGRALISFDSGAYPSPRMPFFSDGTLTFAGVLLRGSPEIRVDYREGRTIVEIPSYRPGPFGACRSLAVGASDLDTIGQDCVSGSVLPGRDLVLDLGGPR